MSKETGARLLLGEGIGKKIAHRTLPFLLQACTRVWLGRLAACKPASQAGQQKRPTGVPHRAEPAAQSQQRPQHPENPDEEGWARVMVSRFGRRGRDPGPFPPPTPKGFLEVPFSVQGQSNNTVDRAWLWWSRCPHSFYVALPSLPPREGGEGLGRVQISEFGRVTYASAGGTWGQCRRPSLVSTLV